MESMCRTCMRSTTKLLPLFSNYDLCYKIEKLSSIQIIRNDLKFPSKICKECFHNINKFYNLRTIIINSDADFRDRFAAAQLQINSNNNCDFKIEHNYDYDTFEVKESTVKNIEHPELIIKSENHEMEENSCIVEDDNSGENRSSKATNRKNYINSSGNLVRHCEKCDLSFEDYTEWENHQKSLHRKYGVCNICGKSVTFVNLKKHQRIHTAKPVTCPVCGKQSKNEDCLRFHLDTHKNEGLACEFCGNVYNSRNLYNTHIKTHYLKKKKIKCAICEKMILKDCIKKHMRVHTGERPFTCQYCKKGFSSTYALKIHIRRHTNEKPYLCEFCPMSFPQKVSLKTHIQSKHSEKS